MDKATYVYCLVSAPRRPHVGRAPRGLSAARPPRLIEVGPGRWLVVADVPLARYGAEAINARLGDLDWVSRAAIAHEAVVEAFIGAAAVLPMRLFTIFSNDERAVSHVAADRRHIDRVLRRVAGKIELGVRVVLDRRARTPPPGRSTVLASAASSRASGADYLRSKKAQREESVERVERAGRAAASLYRRLGKHAALARRRPASDLTRADGTLLLDAAFLVPRTRQSAFRSAVRREARLLARQGYGVVLNGPWPPYSFLED